MIAPTKETAMRVYASAWAEFSLPSSVERRTELGRVMDSMQEHIARGPGPEWEAFIDTLPGFREFWTDFGNEARRKVSRFIADADSDD